MSSRRSFLAQVPAAIAATAWSHQVFAAPEARRFEPGAAGWRTFDVTTRVELDHPGAAQVWVPVPSVDTAWQRPVSTTFDSNGSAQVVHDGRYGVEMVQARFEAGAPQAVVEVTSRVQTRDRAVDWRARNAPAEDPATLRAWTQPTALIPTDGLVRAAALEATRGAKTDVEKASAIYEWVVHNTHREPSVRGCGEGDVRAMLSNGPYAGKCADINALFVGMNRAVGIPARDLYGIRLAPSAFGYRELGGVSEKLAGAQHCRAEVYLTGHGWVAMDPADVTKVMRQETAEWIKTVDNPLVAPVYKSLKGCCEGNWMAYNSAHDVELPGARGGRLGFLMYPIAETAAGRVDPYAPDTFRYRITAREVRA